MDTIRATLSKYMSSEALEFVLTQVRVSNVCAKGRRWTNRDKSLALSLCHSSRKAYRLLQRLFKLPSPKTLGKAIKNVNIKTGPCANILHLLELKVQAMKGVEKVCAVVLDEMALKAFLQYDPSNDEVQGFEDFGHMGRSQKHATHALMFMIRGFSTKWKQPISYVLSNGPVRVNLLLPLLQETIRSIVAIVLVPKLVICDQGSNNRAMCTRLHITAQRPFFMLDNQKIFFMFDPPHLLKSIRNNFKSHGFSVKGDNVSWDHVVKFYEVDCTSPIRLAPKLTRKHISMPPFSHLRVNLATQVLSHSVAAGISTMATLKALPAEAIHTASFVEKFDQLFNCFNSRSLRSKNVMGHAITAPSTHHDFLTESLQWLNTIRCNNKSGTVPCLDGWKLNVQCLTELWTELHMNFGFHYLLTDRLNQDCLENMFSVIRGKGGHRFNPDCGQFKAALRQCMVDSVLITSDRKNCKEDLDTFLFSLDTISSKGSTLAVKTRLQQDVPQEIRQLMLPSTMPSLTPIEQNVTIYISGYVAVKLMPHVCTDCQHLLKGDKDPGKESQVFLHAKNFQGCKHGGLCAPSSELLCIIEIMEKEFRDAIAPALHITGLRNRIIRRLVVSIPPHMGLGCKNGKCDLLFYVANLFTNVRLHHHIKLMNQTLSEKQPTHRNRKAATFSHV